EILSQGKHDNLSFFAFTATPKDTTLQQFCEQGPDGKWHPFHVYSMRQAIEEGFILDVLQNYTTYKTCWKLIRTAEENEEMASSKAARLIRQYATLHPENIRQKSEIIVETFLETTRHKIGGKGKMMVVASSRLAAVLYFRAVKAYAAEQGYADVKPMVAFSGKVELEDGEELTESKLNVRADGTHISEAQTKEEFHNNFNILIVAEKYQTGFDEKLLHTMIVDKKLRSVKCVQTLSRLNRTIYGKEDTYVLDFMNEHEEIKEAFQPFYQETLLEGDLSYDLIYQTKRDLRQFEVYHDDDVEKVAEEYTRHSEQQEAECAAAITNLLIPVIADYTQKLSKDSQYEFRRKLRALCKWYAHIGQITRLNDLALHKEYVFARYLIKVLPTDSTPVVDIEGKIEMEYYMLEETGNGSIQLAGTDGILEPGTATAGGGATDKKEPLDELLNRINEAMGGNFTEANKVAARTIMAVLKENTSLAASARSSNMKVFMDTIFKDIFENAAMDCYVKSMEGFEDLMQDDYKRNQLREKLAHELYRQFRSEYPAYEEPVLLAAEDEK
ncbi:MAG: type I restriction endonuclease subunit R, partial [Akkermansia sp.]|nr:type I restriction endonuclease subunit R [Akkermansia sp.]